MKVFGRKGFTLLEVIITIVIGAIMASVLIQYMGTSMYRSAEPVVITQDTYALNQVMEKMTADYKELLAADSTPLATFQTRVEGGNYGQYSVQTQYITLAGGAEAPDMSGNNRVLKVTVTVGDQALTGLFTK